MRTLWLVPALLLVACKKPEAEVVNPPVVEPVMEPSRVPPPAPAEPPGVQPMAPPPGAIPPPVAAVQPAESAPAFEAPSAGGLTWKEGDGLVRRVPKSSMRAAEYGMAGDDQVELSVFYFGEGQGGAVEPNIARWLGQFTQADGRDTASKAKRSKMKVQGIEVAIVEAAGAYAGGMGMPGAAAPVAQSDAMLLGAIASGPKGPVFFKLTGPRTSVLRIRPAFEATIKSLHVQ